jgi:hypothetical protein
MFLSVSIFRLALIARGVSISILLVCYVELELPISISHPLSLAMSPRSGVAHPPQKYICKYIKIKIAEMHFIGIQFPTQTIQGWKTDKSFLMRIVLQFLFFDFKMMVRTFGEFHPDS